MTLGITGGALVLPDGVRTGSLLLHDGRIAVLEDGGLSDRRGASTRTIDIDRGYVVPGFVDVHVHGVDGCDTLDGNGAVSRIAARLPRYGVTAFCPTTVACAPPALRDVLAQVRGARDTPRPGAARVLPAHLESNFINPDFKGAQPAACLRTAAGAATGDFSARDILDAIAGARDEVGIVTLAPELPGGLDLVRDLVAAGHRVSLGHSGADYAMAVAAIDAGARHATHLFNRMPPLLHRAPGLVGAVLERQDVIAELICDGHHVHPAMGRVAIAAKGPGGIMAITDGTAGSGQAPGTTASLGGQTIHVGPHVATLSDGTLAGSTLTMDRAFRNLVTQFGQSLVAAAQMCATTPARALGLDDRGRIAAGAAADLVVLDRDLRVMHTIIGGEIAFSRQA